MATAQQKQQEYIDKFKVQAPKYKIKDKVWLTLKNTTTATENKRLDAKQTCQGFSQEAQKDQEYGSQ